MLRLMPLFGTAAVWDVATLARSLSALLRSNAALVRSLLRSISLALYCSYAFGLAIRAALSAVAMTVDLFMPGSALNMAFLTLAITAWGVMLSVFGTALPAALSDPWRGAVGVMLSGSVPATPRAQSSINAFAARRFSSLDLAASDIDNRYNFTSH